MDRQQKKKWENAKITLNQMKKDDVRLIEGVITVWFENMQL